MISLLSQSDSDAGVNHNVGELVDNARTEHDHMNARTLEPVRDSISRCLRPIVCIVDDHLSSSIEEVPNCLLTAVRYLLPEGDCLCTLLS